MNTRIALAGIVFLACHSLHGEPANLPGGTDSKVPGTTVTVNAADSGRVFEGIDALSAGASSRLLMEYPEPARSRILDYLFKPCFGASLQHLKVEIGGDVNSTDGTEPSHTRTREELANPRREFYQRGYEWWLMTEVRKRNPKIILDCLAWGAPGWIGKGKFYSQDMADYIVKFLQGARRYHNLDIAYTGIWNETPYDLAWIERLRQTLDRNGLAKVAIMATDQVGAWPAIASAGADSQSQLCPGADDQDGDLELGQFLLQGPPVAQLRPDEGRDAVVRPL